MKILGFMPIALLVSALMMTGCGPKDEKIQTSVSEKLKSNQETAATVVTVDKGVATLSGELSSESAKSESEAMAKSVKGV